MIDILKYISISVLQVIKSEIKIEAEDCEDIDVKVPYSYYTIGSKNAIFKFTVFF